MSAPSGPTNSDMAMTRTAVTNVNDSAGTLFDVLEDVLHLDHPVRPSVRRRVKAANDDAIRTLRQLGAEDEQLLAPDNVRTICNAIAQRHGVKPRFMLTMRELGEQLALEFASALLPTSARTRLISSAIHLEPRRAAADPRRRRQSDQRPARRVEWIALGQAVVALLTMISAAVLAAAGQDSLGLAMSVAALAFVAFARAALAISSDRRSRLLMSEQAALARNDRRRVDAPDAEIDLRGNEP
jgi:hypothetical protein